MLHNLLKRFFLLSVAIILASTSTLKILSVSIPTQLNPHRDALLHLPAKEVAIISAVIELVVVGVIVFNKRTVLTHLLILCLSVSFAIYRLGQESMMTNSACPCLGLNTDMLPFAPGTINSCLIATIIYFFVGSSYLLIAEIRSPGAEKTAALSVKNAFPH